MILQDYNLDATRAFFVSFESVFLDIRGIIGGSIVLTSEIDVNRGIAYEADTMNEKVLYTSGMFDAMATVGFRVSGISIDWDGEAPPISAVALCQIL